MENTTYDEVCRYLTGRASGLHLLTWLMSCAPGRPRVRLRFKEDGWEKSDFVLPGTKERICDAVARVADLDQGGLPFFALLEYQTTPDFDIAARFLVVGGLLQLTKKPTDLRGDRFGLSALVVNLTGQGNAARAWKLGASEWLVKPTEVDLERLDAREVLEEIARGEAPSEALAWIAVMQKASDEATMQRWLEIASKDTDPRRRGDYALVVVFADQVGYCLSSVERKLGFIRDAWQAP